MKVKLAHEDKVVIIDDKTGIKSVEGNVVEIGSGVVTVSVNGRKLYIDGATLKGETLFGPCTIKKV